MRPPEEPPGRERRSESQDRKMPPSYPSPHRNEEHQRRVPKPHTPPPPHDRGNYRGFSPSYPRRPSSRGRRRSPSPPPRRMERMDVGSGKKRKWSPHGIPDPPHFRGNRSPRREMTSINVTFVYFETSSAILLKPQMLVGWTDR